MMEADLVAVRSLTNLLHVCRRALDRFRRPVAVAGACVAGGQVLWWSWMGAWPFHDSVAYWLAGERLRTGQNPYEAAGPFLAFLYAPPIAIVAAALSLIPWPLFTIALFAGQLLALRYIAGSWVSAGLLGWLPFVPRALVTGNVDLMMGAAILASLRGGRGSGAAAAFFAFCKLSPVLAVRRWREFFVAAACLAAISLPWWDLWLEFARALIAQRQESWLPALIRAPVVVALVLGRRPWSRAMAAGLAVPLFYFHSLVLLLPGCRLLVEELRHGPTTNPDP